MSSLEHTLGLACGLLIVHIRVHLNGFRDLLAHSHERVEAGHGLLKDHGHLGAAHFAPLVLRKVEQVLAIEQDLSSHHLSRWTKESHDGTAAHALAAAGLTHDSHDLAGEHFQ